MPKKIKDLTTQQLSYYLDESNNMMNSPAVVSLIELDPRNEFLREIRTINYRVRQELTKRKIEDLTKESERIFKDLEVEELTSDELMVVIPEWPADPETGEVDFYGVDDGERPVEEPVQEHKEI